MKFKQRKSQPWRRFGYPVLISMDFDDFTSTLIPWFLFQLRRYIKHSRQCFIGHPNTSNSVKNTPLRVVFSTLFSVFGYPDETLSLVFDILHQHLDDTVHFCSSLHDRVRTTILNLKKTRTERISFLRFRNMKLGSYHILRFFDLSRLSTRKD